MSKTRGSKEGVPRDSSVSMPSEQKTSESNKHKISRIYDTFPNLTKDNIAKILQYYDDDESQALDALTRDGGREALSNWAESGSLKNKNNKNKKKKKKAKKDAVSGISATASFDADDSSSLHSGGNIDADIEKDSQQTENGNSILNDDADHISKLSERLSHENELDSNEPEAESKPIKKACGASAPEESSPPLDCDYESIKIPSPLPDAPEKPDEPVMKKDKYRSYDNSYQKYSTHPRSNSFRRSKSSSISEDQSSQQSATAPTKRGYEKCKKDLNRQTISLQRIFSQVDKGFDESAKKIKAVFADIYKSMEQRQKELEAALEKNKIEAINLIKGRQDLAVDLKRRVDRTSLSEAEWSDLRSDIKQFVTERKYDDELGKTIWFHWTDIVENHVKSFGEVTPVKNVYSQRSQSALGNSASNNPEPSPSSSLANDEGESAADKNDVANISDAVELPVVEKEEMPIYNKTHSSENRTTRVYSNTKFNHNRYPGGNHRGQGYYNNRRGGGYNRNNYNTYNRQNNYDGNYRNHPPHHERDGRMNEGPYVNDRNMNNSKEFKFRNRGNRNFNNNNSRYRNNPGGYRHQEKQHPEDPTNSTATGNTENANVNGFVNN